MNDGDALFRAILDDPDDDLPRLAYADWLEENGRQPRAQLIRRMCEAARLAPAKDDASRRRFAEATAEYIGLLARHEEEWLAELPKIDGVGWGIPGEKMKFRRGFVHAISTRDWRTSPDAGMAALTASPVEVLRVAAISAKGLSPWLRLTELSRLELNGGQLDDRAADELTASANFGRLRWLDVGSPRFTGAGIARMLRAPWFVNVERFRANGAALDALGADAPPIPALPRLRHLDIGPIYAPPLVGWLKARTFPHLQRLHLNGCRLGDEGLALLADEAIPSLRHLELRSIGVTALGARSLIDSGLDEQLEVLDLRDNPFTPPARRLLRDRFGNGDCRLLLDGEGHP